MRVVGSIKKGRTNRMRAVFGTVKVCHAVETGEGGAAALVAMAVELLLGNDIAALLAGSAHLISSHRIPSHWWWRRAESKGRGSSPRTGRRPWLR